LRDQAAEQRDAPAFLFDVALDGDSTSLCVAIGWHVRTAKVRTTARRLLFAARPDNGGRWPATWNAVATFKNLKKDVAGQRRASVAGAAWHQSSLASVDPK